jgi:hypothetical protein
MAMLIIQMVYMDIKNIRSFDWTCSKAPDPLAVSCCRRGEFFSSSLVLAGQRPMQWGFNQKKKTVQ